MQNLIGGAAHAVGPRHISVTGFHFSGNTYKGPINPNKVINGPCSCCGAAVALVDGSNSFFHICPKLVKIADFSPILCTVQRHTGRHRLHRQIRIAVTVYDNRICFILTCNIPQKWVCVLDSGQANKVGQPGIEVVQRFNYPVKIEVMKIGVPLS